MFIKDVGYLSTFLYPLSHEKEGESSVSCLSTENTTVANGRGAVTWWRDAATAPLRDGEKEVSMCILLIKIM